MNARKYQLDNFKRFLLNRGTVSPQIVEYIENCCVIEDEANNHSFHKIMVHNWSGNDIQLFDTMTDYFGSPVIPVGCKTSQGGINTFYTSNMNLILKMTKFDFMFPFSRNMFNIDILFNDKCSVDFFENPVTVDDIVNGVVSRRFTEKHELDLSNFSNDAEFIEKKINFYKVSLLSHYKILMLRMGNDTKALNLSNNNLTQAPIEVLNFFIRGDLISINLSNNNIASLNELRVTSKIERLWLEGNPLCEELDSVSYVKKINVRFPRLTELDGIKLNQHGMIFPFFRNYLIVADRKTKMLIEKFVTLYFSHYDSPKGRRKVASFYGDEIVFTIATNFTDVQEKTLEHYAISSRNILHPVKKQYVLNNTKCYNKYSIASVLCKLPKTVHDLTTFNVDVILHDHKTLILAIDGIYKELTTDNKPELVFQFRRTFVFSIYTVHHNSVYHITNEMFYVTFAAEENLKTSFQHPIKNTNNLALINPEYEDVDAIIKAFQHITQLKKTEAELRLKCHSWDIKEAIKMFMRDLKVDKIPADNFIEEDDFSDSSSLLDEID